jgi:hypothetical protein
MFSEPGYWIMIAGAVIATLGFLGLAFSRMGNEMPDRRRNREPNEKLASPDLPDPFPTESNEEARAPLGRWPKAKGNELR